MRRILLVIMMCGCGRAASTAPAGTTSDPVDKCTRAGDVCKLDQARLGVCVQDQTRGLTCAAQH
jgi:hypothetical protein